MPTLVPTLVRMLILVELQMQWRMMEQHYNWERKGNLSQKFGHIYCLEVRDGKEKAICKYCKKALGGESRNGTTHLRDHQDICPMRKYKDIAQDFSQKKLKVETSGEKKRESSSCE